MIIMILLTLMIIMILMVAGTELDDRHTGDRGVHRSPVGFDPFDHVEQAFLEAAAVHDHRCG